MFFTITNTLEYLSTKIWNTFNQSKSFPWKLLDLLYARYTKNKQPLTIFPLELIKNNGNELKKIIINLAQIRNFQNSFIIWLKNEIIWVNSLVDRIVSEEINPVGAITEPYALWAVEKQTKLVMPCNHECISIVSNLDHYAKY